MRDSLVIFCESGDNALSLARLHGASGEIWSFETVAFPDVGAPGGACPIAISPDRQKLYVAYRGEEGRVLSYAIDYQRGKLDYLGSAALPDSMVHISCDQTGRYLFSASYGGAIFAVSEIGSAGIAGDVRQICAAEPKAHCTLVSGDNRFVFVPSIDDESILRFQFDAKTGQAERTETPAAKLPSGAGPRHVTFHPNGKFAYLVNEYGGTVVAFSCAMDGTFTALQTVDITAEGFVGTPSAADIHLTPDGRFLYASDRGSNVIAGFVVDGQSGELQEVGKVVVADSPRGFQIDPSGQWLIALAEGADLLTVYAIDPDSGVLKKQQDYATGKEPNWIEILPMPER